MRLAGVAFVLLSHLALYLLRELWVLVWSFGAQGKTFYVPLYKD